MQRDKFYLSKRQKPKAYLAKPNQREAAKQIRAGFSITKRTRHQQMQPKTVNTMKIVREKEKPKFFLEPSQK